MKMPMEMTLDEAILHCEEVANRCDSRECASEHKQLAEWLKELKERRASELPSVQPNLQPNLQPTCNLATDCISRADVEQTVEDNILCYTHSDRPIDQDADTECHMAIRMALKMLRKDLRKLPSAQPNIIRCKDCRHFEYDHPYIIQSVPVLGHEVCNAWGDGCKTDENGYCFLAERRIDDLQGRLFSNLLPKAQHHRDCNASDNDNAYKHGGDGIESKDNFDGSRRDSNPIRCQSNRRKENR